MNSTQATKTAQSQSAKSHSAHNLSYGSLAVNAGIEGFLTITTRTGEFPDTLGVEFLHMLGTEFLESIKKSLPVLAGGCYGFRAGVNPPAGFDSLIVNADNRTLSVMRLFYVRTQPSYAQFMVGRSGGASALAGFVRASLSTLLRLTTPFDSGSVRFNNFANEAVIMTATPTQTHPKFLWRFMALSRADMNAKPCRLSVEATSEKEARKILAPNFILSFAARLPVPGVRHA